MKEFVQKHPFFTLLIVGVVCATVYDCIYVIKTGNAPVPAPAVKIDYSAKKEGDEKGA